MPDSHQPFNVLFICDHNAVRSQLAEAALRHLGGDRFRAFSAGAHPAQALDPGTVETMQRHGLACEGMAPKSWDVFAGDDAPPMDFIITLCDRTHGEAAPVWPGHPATALWDVPHPDPAGQVADRTRAFDRLFMALHHRIELFVQLPAVKLDHAARMAHLGAVADARPAPG